MKELMKNSFMVSGAWSKSAENIARPICLGLIICKVIKEGALASNLNRTTLAGVAGGCCGGDLFCLEQFVCETSQTTKTKTPKINSLWVGSTDILTGNEVDFNSLPNSILQTCHQALEECWEWNSENNYLEFQELRLYPYNLEGLKKSETDKDIHYKYLPPELSKVWNYLHQGLFLIEKSRQIPLQKLPIKKGKPGVCLE